MQITLPPDIEGIALQAVERGDYESVADFIAETVRRQSAFFGILHEGQETEEASPVRKMPYPEWKKRFEAFLANRKPTNPNFDDRRESMYPDRS